MGATADTRSGPTTGTIRTDIPARLDRLPWARFHWLVLAGLGTAWILDGLEVTLVGSVSGQMTSSGSGISITGAQIGIAAACYVAGACLGALFFGQLTDRFGRKKLFMITLGVYIAATVATGFSFTPMYFFLARFFTGFGIGGEYSAINSAIDELIPARVRGRVDLVINGSYWIGSAMGAALSIFFLDTAFFAKDIGWRLGFFVGASLAVAVLLVRRNVPESPRWLFIHGREEEAERIVDQIEERTAEQTGQDLPEPEDTLEVRQRKTIPFRQIARVAFKVYPRRSLLCLALFVGQAFIYNGVVFNLGGLFTSYFKVSASFVPVLVLLYAIGNFLGPVLLGRMFDTVGRKPMITITYLGSSAVTGAMMALFLTHSLGEWTMEAFIMGIFFLASAGASAAYLTVSEIFPMETRALAIAFFYAIGTAAGGITGPLVFSNFIAAGRGEVAVAFGIGLALMTLGGLAELFLGVRAEQRQLEDIAKPLTAEEADGEPQDDSQEAERPAGGPDPDADQEHREALRCRRSALEERARAAEHRAAVRELEVTAEHDQEAAERAAVEAALAEIAEIRAQAMDERATAHEELEAARSEQSEDRAAAARERAEAARARADAFERQAEATGAGTEQATRAQTELAEAARERARAHEQLAMAAEAHDDGQENSSQEVARAHAAVHEAWAAMHSARARAHELRAGGDSTQVEREEQAARRHEAEAKAAGERAQAAEHRSAEEELAEDEQRSAAAAAELRERDERQRAAHEREERIRRRLERRRRQDRGTLRRLRPGPGSGSTFYSPGMVGSSGATRRDWAAREADREVEAVARALAEHGALDRRELARVVGARYWGPGRFQEAVRDAVAEGRARRVSRATLAPPDDQSDGASSPEA